MSPVFRSARGMATLTPAFILKFDRNTWRRETNSSRDLIQPQRDAFFGTFAPFLRASDKPMAIACFLLFTMPPFPPFPDRKVPFFLRRIALLTVLLAARPYLGIIASDLIESTPHLSVAVGNLPHDRELSVKHPTKACIPTAGYCQGSL
jgi:hypothetical protein